MEINATLIGQLLTFAILVWFTMKYVWPPITAAMHDREKKIAAGLLAAENGQRELIDAEQKSQALIRDAKKEANLLVEQAHKRSAQIIEEAKGDARAEGRRIIELAKEDIAREVNAAKDGLRQQLSVLAIAGAEKIIQRNLDP